MARATDQQRIRHLKATTSAAEGSAIDHAVTLWQVVHGVTDPVNPSTRGSVLAAICAEWVATTVDGFKVDCQGGPT